MPCPGLLVRFRGIGVSGRKLLCARDRERGTTVPRSHTERHRGWGRRPLRVHCVPQCLQVCGLILVEAFAPRPDDDASTGATSWSTRSGQGACSGRRDGLEPDNRDMPWDRSASRDTSCDATGTRAATRSGHVGSLMGGGTRSARTPSRGGWPERRPGRLRSSSRRRSRRSRPLGGRRRRGGRRPRAVWRRPAGGSS